MRPTTLHKCFKFDAIRFTVYRVIAEKPRVSHLSRIFPILQCYIVDVGKLCVGSQNDSPF